jgi:succinyl-diaminopimelate desuccinylase
MDRRLVERLATTTDHLVAFPTVEHNTQALYGCVEWTRAHVYKHKPRLHVKTFQSNNKPSILFSAGTAPPRVLFFGHLDVVEAVHQSAFKTTQEGDLRLKGRGTADMKGPVAAMLDVMEQDAVAGIGLLLTTDEEVGGQDGIGHVLHSIDWRPEVVVLPDGGANMHLVVEQKGMLRVRLDAEGMAAHGSRPWLGDNAIERVYKAYQKLLRAYPTPRGEEDWRVSITLSELHGGLAPNAVPCKAAATLDIRYPQDVAGTAEGLLRDIQRRVKPLGVMATVLKRAPAYRLDDSAAPVRQLQHVAQCVRQRPLDLVREAGASDAHYFADDQVPVLMFQPECAEWHGANEWVNLESLAIFRTMCAAFAKSYLSRAAARPARQAMP